MRTCFVTAVILSAAAWLFSGSSLWGAEAVDPANKAPRPNVLFIAIDDLNHWVGHLGRNKQTQTPNIDRMARLGTTFTRAYCAAPVCNPSRAALMTGLRPGATGIYDNKHDWREAVPTEFTLPTTLRKAGYRVTGAGKVYHGAYERDSEWDDYLHSQGSPKGRHPVKDTPLPAFGPVDAPESEWADYKSADYGIAELGKKHDQPFFVAVGLHKPHMAWNVPRKYYDMFPLDQIELPPFREDDLNDLPASALKMARPKEHDQIVKAGRWKEAVQGYLAAVSFTDAQVGRVLDALEKSPERDRTIVVLWGDHGWHLGEKHHWRKFALWEEATRVPYIWIVPGVTQAGTRCDRTVDLMSVYPTLCDLCSIDKPTHLQGRSLRPLLASPTSEWDHPAITTWGHNNHAVRSEQWRYIRYADGGEELYDESRDPYEWTNLASDPRLAARKSELAAHLPTENKPEARGSRQTKADRAKGKSEEE